MLLHRRKFGASDEGVGRTPSTEPDVKESSKRKEERVRLACGCWKHLGHRESTCPRLDQDDDEEEAESEEEEEDTKKFPPAASVAKSHSNGHAQP